GPTPAIDATAVNVEKVDYRIDVVGAAAHRASGATAVAAIRNESATFALPRSGAPVESGALLNALISAPNPRDPNRPLAATTEIAVASFALALERDDDGVDVVAEDWDDAGPIAHADVELI